MTTVPVPGLPGKSPFVPLFLTWQTSSPGDAGLTAAWILGVGGKAGRWGGLEKGDEAWQRGSGVGVGRKSGSWGRRGRCKAWKSKHWHHHRREAG